MSLKLQLKLILILPFLILTTYARGEDATQSLEPKALFEKRCSKCHSINKTNRTESKEWWTATVNAMKKKSSSGISDEDASVIIDYLTKTKTSPASAPDAGKNQAK